MKKEPTFQSVHQVYEAFTAAAKTIKGEICCEGEVIYWQISPKMEIVFSDDLAEVYYSRNGKLKAVTHWHPDLDEIYEELCAMNREENVVAIVKSMIGIGFEIIPRTAYEKKCRRNGIFKRYYGSV